MSNYFLANILGTDTLHVESLYPNLQRSRQLLIISTLCLTKTVLISSAALVTNSRPYTKQIKLELCYSLDTWIFVPNLRSY